MEVFFTPIINQPEVAILGIGKAEKKQIFIGDKYENRDNASNIFIL